MMFKRRIQDSTAGPTTYIAPSTKIVGTITGKGSYVFCGTVEGDCDINGPLTLAEGGRWKGTIKATDIVDRRHRRGRRDRASSASRSRAPHASPAVSSGNSIAVAEGAIIEGEIKVTSGAPPVTFQEKRET